MIDFYSTLKLLKKIQQELDRQKLLEDRNEKMKKLEKL